MAKSLRADAPGPRLDPAGPEVAVVASHDLAAVIMQLLPAVNDVVAAHGADGGCYRCAVADRRDCPTLGLAAAALDLIVQCWRMTRSTRDGQVTHLSRNLHAAIESRRLTDSEAAALTEIIDVLDLAVAQAGDAGMSLPMLAGIGVAVVDGYRDVGLRAVDDDAPPAR
jgi:hypothetical protein